MHKPTSGHVLPEWFESFQDNVTLSLLVIANMILGGLMFSTGIVRDIETPQAWGVFHGIIFIAFFLAGTGLAGVVLRASAGFTRALRAGWRRWWEAFLNLLVMALFLPIEIWASLTQRSTTRVFTPADTWLLTLIGHPEWPISPTILALSLGGPLVLGAWGIVTRNAEDEGEIHETDEERAARERREIAEAEHQARLARVKAQQQAITALGMRGVVAAALRGEAPTITQAMPVATAVLDTHPEDFPPEPDPDPTPQSSHASDSERGESAAEDAGYAPSLSLVPVRAATRKRASGEMSKEKARWLHAQALLDADPEMSKKKLREHLRCRQEVADSLYTKWQIERRKVFHG